VQIKNGELWVFLKFQKSPSTVSLVYDSSWSVFKSLGKGVECFIHKFKPQKVAFGMRSNRDFWKISSQSLLWTVHNISEKIKTLRRKFCWIIFKTWSNLTETFWKDPINTVYVAVRENLSRLLCIPMPISPAIQYQTGKIVHTWWTSLKVWTE